MLLFYMLLNHALLLGFIMAFVASDHIPAIHIVPAVVILLNHINMLDHFVVLAQVFAQLALPLNLFFTDVM